MRLTELQNCVLAVIWRKRPCSSYEVMQQFQRSTTGEWSSSAGSIYPSISRLEDAGLVERDANSGSARARGDLRPTDEGLAALRAWIASGDPALGQAGPDPLRTRFYFIDAVPPDERRAFLEMAEASTRRALSAEQRALSSQTDPLERLGDAGVVYALRARLRWLQFVRAELAKAASGALGQIDPG